MLAGVFDGRRGINLGIWSQWLYHGTDDKLALVVTVASIVTGIKKYILLGQLKNLGPVLSGVSL